MAERSDLSRLDDWVRVLDDSSYYELLGVLEIADAEAIREAFHQFALSFHPDRYRDESEATLDHLRRVFQRGAEAYRVLSDPALRVRYDLALSRGTLRLAPSELGPPPRAAAEDRRALVELARSVDAKLAAGRASKLIAAGNLTGARRALAEAVAHDGGANSALTERLEALDVAIFAMGGEPG
ncbi:MAG: J domain-containing protein [Sorangiineae bacterium]|nr:J domain-containing protein [Polyangiaceae bacterium]MEB2324457.1 J domain-containing protein [Sorangiineae bacterium]